MRSAARLGTEGIALHFPKPTKLPTLSQIVFFFLVLSLLLRTEFRGSLTVSASEIRLPYPVSLFFQFDPLVAISNALPSRALYRGLLWSLVVLISGNAQSGGIAPAIFGRCSRISSVVHRNKRDSAHRSRSGQSLLVKRVQSAAQAHTPAGYLIKAK